MSLGMILTSVLELAAVVFVLWAVLNEDRFAAVERRIIAKIRRRRLKVHNGALREIIRER